jgi:hypothetical protein
MSIAAAVSSRRTTAGRLARRKTLAVKFMQAEQDTPLNYHRSPDFAPISLSPKYMSVLITGVPWVQLGKPCDATPVKMDE